MRACGGWRQYAVAHRASLCSDVDEDDEEVPARAPPAAEPEVRRLLRGCEPCTTRQLTTVSQAPALVLPPVEPTDEIRLAGTILSVVGAMIVVQVRWLVFTASMLHPPLTLACPGCKGRSAAGRWLYNLF